MVKALFGQRAYSIRTRIKTVFFDCLRFCGCHVREHIPLEQGLRLSIIIIVFYMLISQRAYSIRTRIKTTRSRAGRAATARQRAYSIRTRIKTRIFKFNELLHLRQRAYSIRTRIKTRGCNLFRLERSRVREHIPLEQGLRPSNIGFSRNVLSASESIFH